MAEQDERGKAFQAHLCEVNKCFQELLASYNGLLERQKQDGFPIDAKEPKLDEREQQEGFPTDAPSAKPDARYLQEGLLLPSAAPSNALNSTNLGDSEGFNASELASHREAGQELVSKEQPDEPGSEGMKEEAPAGTGSLEMRDMHASECSSIAYQADPRSMNGADHNGPSPLQQPSVEDEDRADASAQSEAMADPQPSTSLTRKGRQLSVSFHTNLTEVLHVTRGASDECLQGLLSDENRMTRSAGAEAYLDCVHEVPVYGSCTSSISTDGSPRRVLSLTPQELYMVGNSTYQCDVVAEPSIEACVQFEDPEAVMDSARIKVFPRWFNPIKNVGKGLLDSNIYEEISQALGRDRQLEPKRRFVISFSSAPRLIWDTIWCIALAYDMWSVTVSMAFTDDDDLPIILKVLSAITLTFFCLDILFNFFTSYMEGSVEVFQNSSIVKSYLQGWFWIDVCCTIPWDQVVMRGGKGASLLRVAKIIKILRIGRLVKLVRHVDAVKQAHFTHMLDRMRQPEVSGTGRCMQKMSDSVITFFHNFYSIASVGLMFGAHMHAVIWVVLQEDKSGWEADRSMEDRYIECLWWACGQFLLGNTPASTTHALRIFELVIYVEKLVVFAYFIRHLVFRAMVSGDQSNQVSCQEKEAIQYLKMHNISVSTQTQLLYLLHQTRGFRLRRRRFAELITDVPPELSRTVHYELWSTKLLSLDMITYLSQSRPALLVELAQEVQEEVFPSHGILFCEGEYANAAYNIMEGEVVVVNSQAHEVEPYRAGTWVGEKALVQPSLRRSGTVVAKITTQVLSVQSNVFFQLIERHDMFEFYQTYCAQELWKGLCGRCGSIGKHWAHSCPMIRAQSAKRPTLVAKLNSMTSFLGILGSKSKSNSKKSIMPMDCDYSQPMLTQELRIFLSWQKLDHLQSLIQDLGIYSLSDLEARNAECCEALTAEASVSHNTLQRMKPSGILAFRRMMESKTRRMLSMKISNDQHFLFLSHYKVEAGTEAALLRSELEHMIQEEEGHPGQGFDVPVYLDAENLTDLHDLMQAVTKSHNLLLMCTSGVLTRPWCLIEITCAVQMGVPVLPMTIVKNGVAFTFPDDEFYSKLMSGELIGRSGVELIEQHGFGMSAVCDAIAKVFKRIAITYSPHRPADFRKAELKALLKQAHVRNIRTKETIRPSSFLHHASTAGNFQAGPKSRGSMNWSTYDSGRSSGGSFEVQSSKTQRDHCFNSVYSSQQ